MVNREMALEEYKSAHRKSFALHEEAAQIFAADGATHVSRIFDPYRPYITHAEGSRKWDVDGHEYIDYIMCHGALLLGYSHPEVVRAVMEQMKKGVHYGENHELEIQWARLVQEMVPSAERVEFFPCGNEANMMAVRLGRIFTKREKILRLENHFHGWADELMAPGTPGVPPQNYIVTVPPDDLNAVEQELSKGEYAVLMTEAGGAFMGGKLPVNVDFVRALPELARKYGTVWILDEVVTGFRDSPGGWQSVIGVEPDLTALGKCLGGGLGAGAVVGRADIMAAFSPDTPKERRILHSGTWNANPLTAAAGVSACQIYRSGEPQRKAADAAALLREQGNRLLQERGINGAFYGRSIVHLYFGPNDYEPPDNTLPPTRDPHKLLDPETTPKYHRLLLHLLQRGVANMNGWLFVTSAVHTKEDIMKTVEVIGESLDAMISEGWFSR